MAKAKIPQNKLKYFKLQYFSTVKRPKIAIFSPVI